MRRALAHAPHGNIYATLPRMLSLLLATGLAGAILTYPKALAHAGHGMLSLAMWGMCAGFVHGVGFIPAAKTWRILLSPWAAWILMGLGVYLLLHN